MVISPPAISLRCFSIYFLHALRLKYTKPFMLTVSPVSPGVLLEYVIPTFVVRRWLLLKLAPYGHVFVFLLFAFEILRQP
jgi:hypothetical protein